MVAYNFKPQFAPLVEAGEKRQTIRAMGKRRHANPGEALQLYTGQRTRQCRKLLDATCAEATPIIIRMDPDKGLDIKLYGQWLPTFAELEAFAFADGFGRNTGEAIDEFIRFFEGRLEADNCFHGVLIKW